MNEMLTNKCTACVMYFYKYKFLMGVPIAQFFFCIMIAQQYPWVTGLGRGVRDWVSCPAFEDKDFGVELGVQYKAVWSIYVFGLSRGIIFEIQGNEQMQL